MDEKFKSVEKKFLDITLSNLLPISSLEAVLQINERNMDKETIKNLLDKLVVNSNHNRREIIDEMGIDSYGYKMLRMEIDRRR